MQLVPFASQVYIGLPSLRVAKTVTLSPVAVAVPTFTVAWQLLSASASLLAGQVMSGPPLSTTVTVKLQLPLLSSDVAVTVVVPTGKNEPEAGVLVIVPHSPELAGDE